MKTAAELYPKYEGDDYWYSTGDYQPMLEEFGSILVQVDDHDYQGDSRLLYEKDGKYGYLIFGWGSCSGCDALQACGSQEEVQELMDSMSHDIKWFDSLDELKAYFTSKDWELEWSHGDETKEFIEKVLNYQP